jgi:hypothetical protein
LTFYFFPPNLGAVSDEQGEIFHNGEKICRGGTRQRERERERERESSQNMFADYCWNLTEEVSITYLLTYLLTPWGRVLPEKLKRPELLKKFPAFYGTRRFITAFTRARHLSLS